MASETSQFESSEMLATFLVSTPLLEESWRLCGRANTAAQRSYAVHLEGEVAYVAFSGVQVVAFSDESWRDLVELELSCGKGVFSSFPNWRGEAGKEAVKVHAGLLQLFLSFYEAHSFQRQMVEILNQSKSVVFSGHSLGGAIASLSALWLLSYIQTASSASSSSPSKSVFCITFGSPVLGNKSFSQAILQERWGANFCHIVAQHDIVPRLLFAPSSPSISHIFGILFQFWHFSMISPYSGQLSMADHQNKADELLHTVLACLDGRLRPGEEEEEEEDDDDDDDDDQESTRTNTTPYWPFGSYMFCTDKGALCLDNPTTVARFLYLTMADQSSANSCVQDHLKYDDYVTKLCWQYLQNRTFTEVVSFSESNNEAGIALALQSSGISNQEPGNRIAAMHYLATARQLGWKRNLNNAKMAVLLAKINPCRAELEWYKAYCDDSDEQMGYYDSFKRRGASKREFKVNMNRMRLGRFWDDVIDKMEKNQLTHDFDKLLKYVNASQSYKLLVEPLEIAEYYKEGMHMEKGHYIEHGRETRFKIFDKWWRERKVGDEEGKPRSKYASLTQDSCFWAKVEEARHSINYDMIAAETDPPSRLLLLAKIDKFERYATGLIERKEVSIDVLAKNSSYNLFRQEWKHLRSQLHLLPSNLSGFHDRFIQ